MITSGNLSKDFDTMKPFTNILFGCAHPSKGREPRIIDKILCVDIRSIIVDSFSLCFQLRPINQFFSSQSCIHNHNGLRTLEAFPTNNNTLVVTWPAPVMSQHTSFSCHTHSGCLCVGSVRLTCAIWSFPPTHRQALADAICGQNSGSGEAAWLPLLSGVFPADFVCLSERGRYMTPFNPIHSFIWRKWWRLTALTHW